MSLGVAIGVIIASVIISLIVGGIIGFFVTKRMFEKQLRENPPITEKQIRAMYLQMGRKASEAQIKSTMRAMKNTK